ncbi:CorA family divalent cation transporter [Streptomyces sp. NPDC089799]|uniref:magnesium transporter CorA family protein n=1 Tax=Streptomyces sp. NPDC089799 TaxID=3155066 RepID=UPI00343CE43D
MPEMSVTRTDVAEARARLAEDPFVLVIVELPEEQQPESGAVAEQLGFDPETLDWLGTADEPARAEFLGDRAGFVVPVVQGEEVVYIHVVVTERSLTVVHRGVAGLATALTGSLVHERPPDSVAVLFILLGDALGTFRRAAVRALLESEELEDDMFEGRRPEQVYRLAQLRRHSARLHHFLRPFLEVTDEVLSRRMMSRNMPKERQRLVREFQTGSRMVLADIESLQEATRRAFASYSSLIAGEQNGVINRLAIVSVVFLPLSFITGFFGMNFTFLTDKLETRDEFWLLAVGLQGLVLCVSLYMLHRTRIWRRLREDD